MNNRIHTLKYWIQTRLSVSLPDWTFPLTLLGLLLVTFGPFLFQLGFYQDDWHHVYFGHSLGLPSLWTMFLYDGRPFAAVLYIAGFSILGFQPLHWQISTLLLRFLTVFFTWLFLKELWPEHKRAAGWTALLFAIYPLFKLQHLSVAYTVHWTGFLLFSISLWAMVKSVRMERAAWVYWILGIVTSALHLLFIEYFAGLELVRPLILWLLFSQQKLPSKRVFTKTLLHWLPYVLVLIGFVVYRIYLIPSPEPGYERNIPFVLFDFIQAPLQTGIQLLQNVLQDTLYILVTIWGVVFDPLLFQVSSPTIVKILLLAGLGSAGLFVYLRQYIAENQDPPAGWIRPALLVGLALTILGPIPAWVTGQSVSQENPLWSGRLGMASMAGASLVIVAALEGLIRNIRLRTLVLVILVGFASAWLLQKGDEYRLSWRKQTNFYQQLYWRAPYIQPETTLLSDEEIFPYMGEYPTSFALGNLYPRQDNSLYLNYWFYSILRRFNEQVEDLQSGMDFNYAINFGRFQGNSLNSLVLSYRPEENQCLWILEPEDETLRTLPLILRETAAISNLDRIQTAAPIPHTFPADIFGSMPEPTWCFYYQKAKLALQQENWAEVQNLWQTAEADGKRPQNGVEYLPFIEAAAAQSDWETAQTLTLQANRLTEGMKHTLCPLWEQVTSAQTLDQEGQTILAEVQERLGCFE